VRRGASPEADLPLSELAVVRAELELEDAEHELDSARVALSVLWGEESPDFDRAQGSLDVLPTLPSFDALKQRLSTSADATRFEVEAATLAAAARTAQATAKPDVHGTLGVRRLEGLDDQALVLSVSMPFGLKDRANLAIARNRAERDRLAGERRAAELDRYRTLFARYEELRHVRARHEALRIRMLPSAERALRLAERGYDEARYSFLQVAQAQSVLQGLRRDRIVAAIDYQKLLTELERATAAAGDLAP
jgi:outer membrane protein, heavy metal efflux system